VYDHQRVRGAHLRTHSSLVGCGECELGRYCVSPSSRSEMPRWHWTQGGTQFFINTATQNPGWGHNHGRLLERHDG